MTLKQRMEEMKNKEQPEYIAKQVLLGRWCLKHDMEKTRFGDYYECEECDEFYKKLVEDFKNGELDGLV